MTKKKFTKNYSYLLLNKKSGFYVSRVLRLPGTVKLLLVLIAVAGWGRVVWYSANYGTNWIIRDRNIKRNTELRKKVSLLSQISESKRSELDSIREFGNRYRAKFGLQRIDKGGAEAGTGGHMSLREELEEVYQPYDIRKTEGLKRRFGQLSKKAEYLIRSHSDLSSHIESYYNSMRHYPSIKPIRGVIKSGYGYRIHPILKRRKFHEGIDISARKWTPIRATADGYVEHEGVLGDYGIAVQIVHGSSGFETLYGHMCKTAVVEGEMIKRGDLIGYVGSTGMSTGPHVHYEVRKHGRHDNPYKYLLPSAEVVD